MNKKLLLSAAGLFLLQIPLNAEITVVTPGNCDAQTLTYFQVPIKKYVNAKSRAERGIVQDSVKFENHRALISVPETDDSYLYEINLADNVFSVYTTPKENLEILVTSCDPFTYTLQGTDLAEGMNQLLVLEKPINDQAIELEKTGQQNPETLQKLSEEYVEIQKNFIKSNPENEASLVALMNLDGEDYIEFFNFISPSLQGSILYPLALKQLETEKKGVEMEKRQQALQSGEIEAPNFTLKDIEGKDVSLTEFKGKWVILDFWGSWCPWCIKGFPELKEAYKEYEGKLDIIGIDCRESEKEWKAGVEKYQLPWVNVYNPEGTSLLSEYGVQGFPTKAIIDPEGKIRNITVGHNPEFFEVLSTLMGK